jgi:hypothetical protein
MVMAIDPRRRQKKLEKKKAKKNAQRRELARREAGGLAARIERESKAPILHCVATSNVTTGGLGEVLVSRRLSHGNVAFVVFLLDVYCLGVKDVIVNIFPEAHYRKTVYEKLAAQYTLIKMQPECARKLVEGAVRYALDLGLPPHADYRIARHIFGDISAEACTVEFSYGKDGKPLFIAGPYDDAAKCRRILRLMEKHCGPGGSHYMVPVPPDTLVKIIEEETPNED